MYSVKRLEKGTELKRVEVDGDIIKAIGKQTSRRIYAVVDTAGNVVKNMDGQFEIYTRKATAQRVADWYNNKSRKEKTWSRTKKLDSKLKSCTYKFHP